MNTLNVAKLLGILALVGSSNSYGYNFNFNPEFMISGFGNAGVSVTNATEVDFYAPVFQQKISSVPRILNIGHNPTFAEDTLAGLQFVFSVNDHLAFTTQVVSEGAEDFYLNANWMYINWNINDNWDIKVGRMLDPVLMFSDYIKVNYTYLWSRLPIEVYNFPTSDFEGITIAHTAPIWGDWSGELLLGFGMSRDLDLFSPTPLQVSTNKGAFIAYTASSEIGRLRGSFHRAKSDISAAAFEVYVAAFSNPCGVFASALSPALITVAPGPIAGSCQITDINSPFPFSPATQGLVVPVNEASKLLTGKNIETEIFTLGYDLKWHNIIAIAEWYKIFLSDKYYLPTEHWYVTFGYSWDKITPHITYATNHVLNVSSHFLRDTAAAYYVNPFSYFSPLPLPQPQTFEQAINDFFQLTTPAESSIDVGVRYDVADGIALKFDYRYVMPERGSQGSFDVPPGKRISFVTFLVAVVF